MKKTFVGFLAMMMCLACTACAPMNLEKAEEKKHRSRQGSIGYRKAKARKHELSRKIRKLKTDIALPYEDYHVTEPEYFKIPVPDDVALLDQSSSRKRKIKLCSRLAYQSRSDFICGIKTYFSIAIKID